MRTFATRLALDPVLDVQSLDPLTKPDPASDARARLRGLLAVLTRVGMTLPTGLTPGEPADRLRATARVQPDARPVEWDCRPETVPDGLSAPAGPRPIPWLPWPGLALAQMAAGLPLAAWGLRHRSTGWLAAGTLLLAHGVLGVAYGLTHPRD